jgi:hypothetical protein
VHNHGVLSLVDLYMYFIDLRPLGPTNECKVKPKGCHLLDAAGKHQSLVRLFPSSLDPLNRCLLKISGDPLDTLIQSRWEF